MIIKESTMRINVYSLKGIEEARDFEALLRKGMSKLVESGNYSQWAEAANDLATVQGALKVFRMVELLDQRDATTLECIQELTDMFSYGADDTGSGRVNDVRRAFHDGIRQVASRQLQKLYRAADKEFYPEEVEY